MSKYEAGRRKEWECRKALAKTALLTTRAAGSKGLVDVIAIHGTCVDLVQVKYVQPGAAWRDANWRKLLALILPHNVHALAYVYRRGCREPEIHTA